MKVLLCIGHVPDTTSKIRFTENDTVFDTKDIQYIVGPYEELALTRLLEIKEQIGDLNITAINVGPQDTEPTIRKALAVGADDAIRVNAEATDALFVAKQIAEVFKNGDYDFIVTGRESIDFNGAQVGEMIAELLDIPSISSTTKIEIDGKTAKLNREIDGGKEALELEFPFVSTAGKGFALEPRIPSMRGIMQARKKPLQVIEPISQEVKTKTNKFYLPESKAACKFVDAEDVDELVRLLHEEAKVI
ncbi:MAG: electron transfer flavoprotein subunit beta/FixA family protein [Bacteroidales bacterium]|nr:electron transfer flavoprotein subunit beta/FixA family protein [Bacteroidales bacterium]MBN2757614.1 electron transfer flavoprotein subunit beta/FixA family protein [Bacteroidales bacterium]